MVSVLLIALAVWEIIWKGIGMWKAARNSHLYWFTAILVFNTAGILPIIYIYFFQKKKDLGKKEVPQKKETKPKKK